MLSIWHCSQNDSKSSFIMSSVTHWHWPFSNSGYRNIPRHIQPEGRFIHISYGRSWWWFQCKSCVVGWRSSWNGMTSLYGGKQLCQNLLYLRTWLIKCLPLFCVWGRQSYAITFRCIELKSFLLDGGSGHSYMERSLLINPGSKCFLHVWGMDFASSSR